MRDNYGFYNYSSHKEMRRLLDGKIYDYSQHFRHFSTLQSDHIAEVFNQLLMKNLYLAFISKPKILKFWCIILNSKIDACPMGRFDDKYADLGRGRIGFWHSDGKLKDPGCWQEPFRGSNRRWWMIFYYYFCIL